MRQVGDLATWDVGGPSAAGFGEDRVDAALDVRRYGLRTVDGAQPAEPRLEIPFNRVRRRAVARDEPRDTRVVRREVGGAIPRHQRDPILRQQAFAHERGQRVHTTDHRLVPAAPHHHEEDALVGGDDVRPGRAAVQRFRVPGGQIRRQRLRREMPDVLGNAVFEQGEILLLQIRDRIALAVHDADIHRHHGDADANRGRRLRRLLPQRNRAAQEQEPHDC